MDTAENSLKYPKKPPYLILLVNLWLRRWNPGVDPEQSGGRIVDGNPAVQVRLAVLARDLGQSSD
jgi:hypothetical protein